MTFKKCFAELRGASADLSAGVREGHPGDFGSRVNAPSEAQHPANFRPRFHARSPVPRPRRSPEQPRGAGTAGPGHGSAGPALPAPAEGPAPPLSREAAAGSARCFRAPGPGREARRLRRARCSLTCPPEALLHRGALRTRGRRVPQRPPGPRPPHGLRGAAACAGRTGQGRGDAATGRPAAPRAGHLSPRVPAQVRPEARPLRRPPRCAEPLRNAPDPEGREKRSKKEKKKKKKRYFTRSLCKSWRTQSQRLSLAYRLGGKRETE